MIIGYTGGIRMQDRASKNSRDPLPTNHEELETLIHQKTAELEDQIDTLKAEVQRRKDINQIMHCLEYAVVQIDIDDTIKFHNNAFLEMAEVPEIPEDATITTRPSQVYYTGRSILDVILPEEHEKLRLAKIAAKAKRLSDSFLYRFGVIEEFTFVSYRGIRTPVSISITYAKAYDAYQLSITDITELKESEERFRYLSEATFESVLITANGIVMEANDAACVMFGYRKNELVGFDSWNLIASDSIDVVWNNLQEDSGDSFEAQAKRKDNSQFTAQMHTKRLAYRGDTAVVLCIRDITSLKRIENRFRIAAEITTDLIYEWDPNTDLAHWYGNLKKLGVEATRTMSCAFSDLLSLMHPEDRQRAQETMDKARWSPEPVFAKFRLKDPDGTWHYWTDRVVAVTNDKGNPVTWIGVCADITDKVLTDERQRKLEAQIQHAQKLESLGVLAGGVAHDFNNLLMGILGNADLALMDLQRTSPVYDSIQNIRAASQKAADLSKQMLAYSGRGRFVIEPVRLPEIIQEMKSLLEVSVPKRSLLRYDLDDTVSPIEGDVAQLQQALMSLITNASEAIGDEKTGVITLSVGSIICDREYFSKTYLDENLPEGEYVFLEVSDTGCGMTEEVCEKVFEPFFTTKFTGRGLGMSAVLGIVRGHSGAINVYSEPGRGTTFKLLFPAAWKHRTTEAAAVPDENSGTGGTVLLVDDEETVCIVAERMLRRAGFTPLIAQDGQEAIDLLESHAAQVVCVLLDLTMPGMSGEDVFRKLHRTYPDVPIIMSSGYNENDIKQRFAGKRVAGIIQKPYRYAALMEVLKTAIGEDVSQPVNTES